MNGYELSRNFCEWAFNNPEKIKPIHYAIYYFSIEHCNRLGWKDKFGLPSQMVMEAIGVKNWRTYSSGLTDLVDFGFIKMIEISKNQYSSNIIAIVKNTKAHTKALDKALSKHSIKHSRSTYQSTVSIDKQLTSNNEQVTNNKKQIKIPSLNDFFEYVKTIDEFKNKFESLKFSIQSKYEQWVENGWRDGHDVEIKNWKTKIKNTLPHLRPINNFNTTQNGNQNNNNNTAPVNAKQTLSERMDAAKRRASERRNQQSNSTGTSIEPFSDFEDVS